MKAPFVALIQSVIHLLKGEHSIHEAISKNSLALFKRPQPKPKTKLAKAIAALKNDISLFSRLYIVATNRECDMQTFFKHENQPYPPSISDYGKLRSTKKSDLLSLLAQNNLNSPPELFDSIVFDGGALVHLLSTTFDQYANEVIIPHILKQLQRCTRVDIVWDCTLLIASRQVQEKSEGKALDER